MKNKDMKETLISFETAKLAKEKGFKDKIMKWRGKSYYNYKGEVNGDALEDIKETIARTLGKTNNYDFECISAPTQALLQKWLREYRGVLVLVDYNYEYNNTLWTYYIKYLDTSLVNYHQQEEFSLFEEALEAGLYRALIDLIPFNYDKS